MIVTVAEMQDAEQRLFAGGVEPEPLMDRAGLGIARCVQEQFARGGGCGTVVAFVGTGHNGGDALVAARHLARWGWRIELRFVDRDGLKPLARKKLGELEGESGVEEAAVPRQRTHPLVALDGLLGIGARGALRGAVGEAAHEINRLRAEEFARTVAIDLPSGLDGDRGAPFPGAVVADLTVTIAHPKAGLLADEAVDHVGRLALVPLDEIAIPEGAGDCGAMLIEPRRLAAALGWRRFDTHKGVAGRVGVIAGSRGMTGAGVLTASAAVRGGAGLVTLLVPEDAYAAAVACAPAEVMVRPTESYTAALREMHFDVLAVGPGLGGDRAGEVTEIVARHAGPCVVDADALNMVARGEGAEALLGGAPAARLVTPHPGEMERLMPRDGRSRRAWAEAFAARLPEVTLLLKGARTIVKEEGRPAAFNPTGHPGMATGGVGDTLTGLCAALMARGHDAYTAACVGSWINGRAAELAAPLGGEEAFAASDAHDRFGEAFAALRAAAHEG